MIRKRMTLAHPMAIASLLLIAFVGAALAQDEPLVPAPPRGNEGEGPFERLILRGATLIDGTGGMPRGPVDIVIEANRIVQIKNVGAPHVPIDPKVRPTGATKEIDASHSWVLPGFVDLHVHVGGVPKAPEAEYSYKLWMAHGITTVRGVPAGPMNWSLSERERSARNEIVAPRIFVYHRLGQGEDWKGGPVETPEKAREWVRFAAQKGIDGLKLDSHRPEIMAAALDEGKKYGFGSTAHLSQIGVAEMNAIDAVRLGLGTVTHFYGMFESLYDHNDVQPWPPDANYNDEQDRFSQVARQWDKIYPQGSPQWNALLDEFLEHKTILDPTMTAYLAGRDLMREQRAEWHEKYTLPSLWDYYRASRTNHGSYFYNWTTWDEVAWRNFYRVWMQFVNDYKNRGGRVTVSEDAAFIYSLFGFAHIEEMELLQEAGFHPLEIFRGATKHGAEALFEPKGKPIEFGVVRPGLLADLVVIDENPIANLKVLYGTGFERLNDETGRMERVGGVKYTIKDGIVYDAKELLADVARMVERQKMERRATDAGAK
jgi:imidazolonepropionase-like amidohydrolase